MERVPTTLTAAAPGRQISGPMLLVCLILLGAGAGCRQEMPASPSAATPKALVPDRAQPRLATLKVWVGQEELVTELARTPAEIQRGLMFRTNVAENEAMLFVFPRPHRASFWMKNVPIPLSCAYIDPAGVILEVHPMEPFNENPIQAQSSRIQYVLETQAGWFQRHGIQTGAVVRTELGSLQQTFWGDHAR